MNITYTQSLNYDKLFEFTKAHIKRLLQNIDSMELNLNLIKDLYMIIRLLIRMKV